MAALVSKDKYANMALMRVVESAANTLTFLKLETGISINQKVAWLLNRIEYFPNTYGAAMFNADGDSLVCGLSVGNSWTQPLMSEKAIIDIFSATRNDYGVAASSDMRLDPYIKDLSTLPGGGLMVPPAPFYGFVRGSSLVAAMTVYIRIFYTTIDLTTEDYWELAESFRPLSA
jgi:hypothetical protein